MASIGRVVPSVRDELERGADVTRAVLGAALAPGLDVYEAGVRIATDVQLTVAKVVRFEPASRLAATCAGLTRDVAAAQLSAVRWFLDA